MKKSLLWIVAVMIICTMSLFGMAGCGSSSEEEPATEETTTVETTTEATTEAATDGQIGEDKALEIALADAGLTANDVDYSNVHLDIDDGRNEYDVEFRQGITEYDYSIDVNTGAIIEKDVDNDND